MNKKGQAFTMAWKMFYWLIISIVSVVVIFFIGAYFAKFIASAVYAPEETYIQVYTQRFIGSPSCFAYQDPLTGRTMQGVIDESKYRESVLRRCYDSDPRSLDLSVTLEVTDPRLALEKSTIYTEDFGQLKTKYPPTFVWVRKEDGTMLKGRLVIGVG